VGYGGISTAQVLPRLVEEYKKVNRLEKDEIPVKKARVQKRDSHGIVVKGEGNMLVRFSHCCNPVPGDDIIGYVTRGRGVSVHRRDCVNIKRFEKEREIDVAWEDTAGSEYSADIMVSAHDHMGLFMAISNRLLEKNVNIKAVNAHTNKQGIALINFTIDVTDTDKLNSIINQLKTIPNVIEVKRIN